MARLHSSHHSFGAFALWLLGGTAAYLILRELTSGTRQRSASPGPTTPSTMSSDGLREVDRSNGDMDQQLDAAVDSTFPASDPYSMQFE
jgi:hypothetical protein